MSKQSKTSSVTRTIRLNEDVDQVLQKESERLGMSMNALINKILIQYKDTTRFHPEGTMITLSKDNFSSLINQLSIEEIEDIAYEKGNHKIKESLFRRGKAVNYTNILWHVSQNLGEYSGWLKCTIFPEKNTDRVHLSHPMGRKWSYFLANYISSVFQKELELKIQSVILENDVHLTISK
jgi:hypothetical protein